MDYQKHYDTLINRARTRILEGYSEKHHILPHCLKGGDEKENIVRLTAEEHFCAHILLCKLHPGNHRIALAVQAMSMNGTKDNRPKNKMYGWLRRIAATASSELQKGKVLSPERRLQISVSSKNSPAVMASIAALNEKQIGVPRTEETKRAIGLGNKGKVMSDSAKALISKARSGKPLSEAHKLAIGEGGKGRVFSDEHKKKISSSLKGIRLGATMSEETKLKIGNSNRGRKMSPEAIEKSASKRRGRKASKETIAKMLANKTPEQRKAAALKAWETKRKNKELQNGVQT